MKNDNDDYNNNNNKKKLFQFVLYKLWSLRIQLRFDHVITMNLAEPETN